MKELFNEGHVAINLLLDGTDASVLAPAYLGYKPDIVIQNADALRGIASLHAGPSEHLSVIASIDGDKGLNVVLTSSFSDTKDGISQVFHPITGEYMGERHYDDYMECLSEDEARYIIENKLWFSSGSIALGVADENGVAINGSSVQYLAEAFDMKDGDAFVFFSRDKDAEEIMYLAKVSRQFCDDFKEKYVNYV